MIKKITPMLFSALVALTPIEAPAQETNQDTYEQLELLMEVFQRVRASYVEEVDDKTIIESAIRGILNDLDPHSGYIDAEGVQAQREEQSGEYAGVGMEVIMENGILKVVAPIDESPASRAGLLSGDLITHVDGKSLSGLDQNEAVEELRGPVGSEVKLTIMRVDKTEVLEFDLIRATINNSAIRSRVEAENVGYIRLTTFNNEKISRDLRRAIRKIRDEVGGSLQGYIIDLRNNPGGLLGQAVEVSDTFLERGEIVSMRGRNTSNEERWNATKGDLTNGLPIVLLTNAGTASASEIVVGALQDHKRAVVLGTKTFGKGIVQSVIPLGRDRAIRLTTARYYTPSGASIQAKGINPDILYEMPIPRPEGWKPRREADLDGHIDGNKDVKGKNKNVITKINRPMPEYIKGDTFVDFQLNYAVELIKGVGVETQIQAAINEG
ncbi:MAG: S41 family peptidase [Sphingomonadales bacterium]|jgi:carboxyl-terminal processing protease